MNAALATLGRVMIIASLGCWLVASEAVGQSPRTPARHPVYRRAASGSPKNPLRPVSYTSTRTSSRTTPAAGSTVVATNVPTSFVENGTEIVDGGTYYEDPQTGRLVPTYSEEHAAALGAMSGPGSRPSALRTTTSRARVASRTVQPVQNQPVQTLPSPKQVGPVQAPSDVVQMGVAEEFCEGPDCGGCGVCADCVLMPVCGFLPMGNLELSAGVQGFTGPFNLGGSGSFGFQQGLNFGLPLPSFGCMGGQIGFRAVQSNLSGAQFTNASRNQGFVTAGLFRRVDFGLQGGVVLDWMTQSWYSDTDLTQLRGELSWVFDGCHDIGFWFTASSATVTEPTIFDPASELSNRQETWAVTDLYAFFYRYQFGACQNGEARLFAGWTGQSDGLIGLDLRLPLADTWALDAGVSYLVPEEGAGVGLNAGHAQESWNVGISLVWTPRGWGAGGDRYYRPLFRVADNGNFMVDRQ